MGDPPKRLSTHRVFQVAAAAIADPRTVRKVSEGKAVRGSVGDRIKEELLRRGWLVQTAGQ
jgi:hypothetical protein